MAECTEKYAKNLYFFRLNPKLKSFAPMFKDDYRRVVRSIDGCNNWYDLSFKGTMSYVELDGSQIVTYKPDRKYEDLAQIFKNDIPYSKIIFDQQVTKIDYSDPDQKIKIHANIDKNNGKENEENIVEQGMYKNRVEIFLNVRSFN